MAGTKVTVRNNGPLRIEGDFTICDQEGKEYGLAGRTVISLCNCHVAPPSGENTLRHRNEFGVMSEKIQRIGVASTSFLSSTISLPTCRAVNTRISPWGGLTQTTRQASIAGS